MHPGIKRLKMSLQCMHSIYVYGIYIHVHICHVCFIYEEYVFCIGIIFSLYDFSNPFYRVSVYQTAKSQGNSEYLWQMINFLFLPCKENFQCGKRMNTSKSDYLVGCDHMLFRAFELQKSERTISPHIFCPTLQAWGAS